MFSIFENNNNNNKSVAAVADPRCDEREIGRKASPNLGAKKKRKKTQEIKKKKRTK